MDEQPERISRVENCLIGLWAVLHLGFFWSGAYLIRHLTTVSAQAQLQRQEARLATNRAEPGRTQPEQLAADARPAEVRIGLYIDRIPELSIRDSHWRADLYLWLNWVEPPGQRLTPGESLQIPNGTILSQVLLRSTTTPVGAQQQRYELYRMEVEVSKLFEVGRFPLDSHLLTLNLEDLGRPVPCGGFRINRHRRLARGWNCRAMWYAKPPPWPSCTPIGRTLGTRSGRLTGSPIPSLSLAS